MIGLDFDLDISYLFFNICTLTKSPTSPGINDKPNPDIYIEKLDLAGMLIFTFLNKKCQRKKRITHPNITKGNIISKNSVLKFNNLSKIILSSEKNKNAE